MNSLTQTAATVNGIMYDESIREYRVIVDGVTVNFATHYGTACYQQAEALRIRRDHFQSCPQDFVPNPMLNVCPDVKARPFRLQAAKPSPVSRDSSGANVSLMGAGYRRVE